MSWGRGSGYGGEFIKNRDFLVLGFKRGDLPPTRLFDDGFLGNILACLEIVG